MSALRPYQVAAVQQVQQAFRSGAKAVCLQLPTGAGKTHLSALGIIAPTVARGRRVIFLADLEEIILDTVGRLRGLGIPCAPILAGRAEDPTAPVQVASQDTLTSWLSRGVEIPPADRVILDECHGSSARTTRELLAVLRGRGALLTGLTATPARGDGLPLSEFDRLVCGPQPRELVGAGALVPCEVLSPPALQDGLAMDPREVVMGEIGRGRRGVLFVPTSEAAVEIAQDLTAAGHPTEAVLGTTPREVRRGVRDRLASGETRHVTTCQALVKGFDAPQLDLVVLSTVGTVTTYLQSIGRALRPCPSTGKRDALVVDLRGAVYAHGLPLADRSWSLDGAQGIASGSTTEGLRRCAACHAVFVPQAACPRCGARRVIDCRPLRIQRAELWAASSMSDRERAERYLMATVRVMRARGMRPDRAAIVARKKAPAWVREVLGG